METPVRLRSRCARLFRCLVLPGVLVAGPVDAETLSALVVTGLGGTPAYTEQFSRSADAIATALATLSSEATAVKRLDMPERDALLDAIGERATAAGDEGLFALILIGHGTVDSRGWKFNLPGPDPGTDDLVAALAQVHAARQLVVLASSASGALLEILDQPGRLLVTATRSGGEVNAVRFPTHLAEALTGDKADLDRNEILTLAEAFRFAAAAVDESYERENLLASEHPQLAGDGANTLALARLGALASAADDPAVAALLDDRMLLETAFAALRREKSTLATADYYAQLETLLLRIARLQLRIDEATGWSEADAGS